MDIIKFSEDLHKRIKEIEVDGSDDLILVGKALATIREILSELKKFSIAYTFSNDKEEIQFFKEVKPVLLSQYIYYKKRFKLLLFDSFRDRKSRINNYHDVLHRLQRFADKNQAFYEYCMSGATYLDNQYFIRNNANYIAIEKDEPFSTAYDVKLSKILANELLKKYILDSIRKLKSDRLGKPYSQLQWTAQKVALVELIYALHAAGTFNYGKTDIKTIIGCFEEMFSIDLGNYARVFSEIRIRKSGQTNFLDHLKVRLTEVSDSY